MIVGQFCTLAMLLSLTSAEHLHWACNSKVKELFGKKSCILILKMLLLFIDCANVGLAGVQKLNVG